MTWRIEDKGKSKGAVKGLKAPRIAPEPVQLEDAEGEPTMTVFEAMQVGVNGTGVFGEPTRYPGWLEQELEKDYGMLPEHKWDVIRRLMFRDTEAV